MTKAEFVKCLAVLSAGTGRTLGDSTIDVWFDCLKDLPGKSVQTAVKRWLMESETSNTPAVGLIRRFAIEAVHGEPIPAEEAFKKVRTIISHFGHDSKTARKHLGPAIWSVLEGIGGYMRVCESKPEERATLFAQFRDAWVRHSTAESRTLRLPADVRPGSLMNTTTATVKKLLDGVGHAKLGQ